MNWKKVAWLVSMGLLCLALLAVVSARIDAATAYPDNIDPDAVKEEKIVLSTPTPHPIQDEWPDIDITLPQYAGFLLCARRCPDRRHLEHDV